MNAIARRADESDRTTAHARAMKNGESAARHQAEESLDDSEERFRLMAEKAMALDLSRHRNAEQEIAETSQRLADSRESERLHLAQELHDGPLQELHGVRMRLDQLAAAHGGRDDQSAFGEVQLALRDIIDRLRSICTELRPPALWPFGLEVAIRSHAALFQSEHPAIHVELELASDKQRLPERTRLALYRIYQHALENIARHGEADHIRVVLRLDPNQVTLRIRDDGRGFEVPSRWLDIARGGHLGLLGASERAAAIGGQLKVVSAPGEGTLVQVTAPLPAEGLSAAPTLAD